MTESLEQRRARLLAEVDELDRRYAEAEATKSGRSAATARRGPISLIAVCLGVALAVGLVAAVDLRRLQTPTGTALAWTGAAVFGDCTAYRELSRPVPGSVVDPDEQCMALRESTAAAREQAGQVAIDVVGVEQDGDRATARVRVERPDLPVVQVPLPLRRDGDGWVVVLDDRVCNAIGCA